MAPLPELRETHLAGDPGRQDILFEALLGVFWLLNSRPSYYVNRDTLFCYHKASEVFLQRLMALYVASHYKVTAASLWVDFSSEPQHMAVPLTWLFTSLVNQWLR